MEFWDPRDPSPALYETETYVAYKDFHVGRLILREAQHRFLAERPGAGRRLLDVGCGNGSFLAAAREAGFEVHGLDFDPKSVAVAREHFGIADVQALPVAEYAVDAARRGLVFDVVTFWEVLEHQAEPRGFVAGLRPLLGTGGILAGSVPNGDRVCAFLDRTGPGASDVPPHHFLYWSGRSLEALFQGAGFGSVRVDAIEGVSFVQVYQAWEDRIVRPALARLRGDVGTAGRTGTSTGASRSQPSRLDRIARPAVLAAATVPLAAATLVPANLRGTSLYFRAEVGDGRR
jgi:SAM-dependent methyltransferase